MIARMSPSITLSRASAIGGLLLCSLLAPIVAHAAALPDGGEPAWVASLSGLHGWATDVAPGSVYRSLGLVTPIVYLLLLCALWLSRAPGTRFLRWVLAVAAVADAFAYGLPSSVNGLPGTIEFFCLPLLLVGVGIAAWNQRGKGAWPWLVGLCVPLTLAGMALVQYWPHGALLAVALACSLLTWATRAPAPATSGPPLPQPS